MIEDATLRLLKQIGPEERRLHNRPLPFEKLYEFKPLKIDDKPCGLWYDFGGDWLRWCNSETEGWISPYIYEIIVDETKIKKISNLQEFDEFQQEYQRIPEWLKEQTSLMNPFFKHRFESYEIDYPTLAQQWCGLEITPYRWERRLESRWYYGWDCASGCIWAKEAIKEIKLFACYDTERDEFIMH